MSSGCDLPDRHDIGIFRKPAVWEVADSSAAKHNRIEPSGLSGNASADGARQDTWHFWYLHHIDPTGIVGGVEMQSQRIVSPGSGDQIEVTLHERLVTQSDVAENTSAMPRSAWKPNTFRYLTANDQTLGYAIDGGLVRAKSRFRFGFVEQRRSLEVTEDQVDFTADGIRRPQSKSVAHQGKLAGPLAVYRSLLGHPLAPRKQREVTVVLPLQELTAELRIIGQPPALARRMTKQGLQVDSLHEAIAILSIDSSRQRQQYYWYDDEGVVQATNVSGDARFTYRCDEQQYTEMGKRFLDQEYPIVVEIPGKEIAAGQLTVLALDVEQSPHSLAAPTSTWLGISAAPRQYLQRIDESHQRVVMAGPSISLAKYVGVLSRYDSPVELADLAATPVLDYGAAGVKKVLNVTASTAGISDQETAIELNRTVHSLLSFVPLSTGVRSASSIAQSSLGDSTEHAILLAAMLRAKNIPARMAVGLRYLPNTIDRGAAVRDPEDSQTSPTHSFVYHAWVVAKAEEGWISLDPTTGKPTGPECLTLEITNLSELDAIGLVNRYLAILRSLRLTVSTTLVDP